MMMAAFFEYFWLRNDAICSLCATETMITYHYPSVVLVMTYTFSYLDIMVL
jgi:hypothetical protein